MGIGEERQTGALLAGNARVDPEIRDLLRPPCGGAEAVAWQATAQRPWKWRFRDIDLHARSADCLHLEHPRGPQVTAGRDRKSTRLNSSHLVISYAVFCLKKKNRKTQKI